MFLENVSIVRFFNETQKVFFYFSRWLLIICLGLIVYAQTFAFDFVFDDHLFIVTNPYIKSFDALSLIWEKFPATRMLGMYSFAVNYQLGQLHPQGYHIFNFLIHLIATGLVWALAGRLFCMAKDLHIDGYSNGKFDVWIGELAYWTALLFLVHPCQTQAVTYISQRYESMAAVFYLAAVYLYLQGRTTATGKKRILLVGSSMVLAFLGIMTKETALTIPMMWGVLEWIWISPYHRLKGDGLSEHSQKTFRKSIKAFVGLGVFALIFACVFMKLVHNDWNALWATVESASHDGDVFTAKTYLLTQARVFLKFVSLLLVPFGQNVDHDFIMSTSLINPTGTCVGLFLIGVFVYLIVRLRRSQPLIAFGLIWMLVVFVVNCVPRQNAIFEHKIYLISFGFFLVLSTILGIAIESIKIRRGVFVLLIGTFMVLAFNRNAVWKNDQTLWEDAYQKSPKKSRVNANLGQVYSALQNKDRALMHLNAAIAAKKNEPVLLLNRGILHYHLGRLELALEDINRTIQLDYKYFPALTARAMIWIDHQKYPEAFSDLAQAIKIRPENPEAYVIRGTLWMHQGHDQLALTDFNRALEYSPFEYGALINRGAINFKLGQFESALQDFIRAHNVNPSELTLRNQVLCLVRIGRVYEAVQMLDKVVQLDPENDFAQRMRQELLSGK